MRLQNIVLGGIAGLTFLSGISAADGGGHKEILPDETIIAVSYTHLTLPTKRIV